MTKMFDILRVALVAFMWVLFRYAAVGYVAIVPK